MKNVSILLTLATVTTLAGCAEPGSIVNQTTSPVVSTQSSQITPGTEAYKTYSEWDLSLGYPATFYVEKYNDEFQSGQTNLRITSQRGSLFRSAGGPATPTSNEFTTGYQMTIAELIPGQDPVGSSKLAATNNPLVKQINFICDGAGCDKSEYLVSTQKGKYVIRVDYSSDYDHANSVTDYIINSIKE